MTVQGEASTAPAVDRDAAEDLFTEIFREFMPRVRAFIWTRLDTDQRHLAEDLCQNTFLAFWREVALPGKLVNSPFGLLCTMARHQMWEHLDRRSSRERALDFCDPANTPILAHRNTYAAERPDASLLVKELDQAMDRMSGLSTQWQKLHQESYRLRCLPQGDPSVQARITEVDQAEEAALATFRESCRRVGQLRAEIEAVAGPGWRSTTVQPPRPVGRPGTERTYRADPTITHCPAGHRVDYHNTLFEPDGTRVCRACRTEQYNKRRAAKGDPAPKPKVPLADREHIAMARRMLADPQYAHLSVKEIARQTHTSSGRLYSLLPVAHLRAQALAEAAR